MERFIAVDNVCAWPNLTLMPDGAIAAVIHNQPTHGRWAGDVECWASEDGGRSWQRRGVPAPHEPGTGRMNHAAGLARDGSLVVIASGFSPKPPAPPLAEQYAPPGPPSARLDFSQTGRRTPELSVPVESQPAVLPSWVCRSSDGGRTWEREETVTLPEGAPYAIPFGDVVRSPDGTLGLAAYWGMDREHNTVCFLRSRDDGRTWGEAVLLGPDDYNETALLCLGGQRWLAASRTVKDAHLDLFASEDGGSTWTRRGPLTLPQQHPAHLLRLADGRILLVYGIRHRDLFGVGARLSPDEGHTWGPPMLLVNLEDAADAGYPSSVQLEDGTIITAYYCNGVPAHRRYHMGIVRWRTEG